MIDKYNDIGRALCLSAIALLPYSSAFGLNTYLIAQNKEKILSIVSIACLLFSFALLIIFKTINISSYDLYFFVPLLTYIIYTITCAILVYNVMSSRITVKKLFLFIR